MNAVTAIISEADVTPVPLAKPTILCVDDEPNVLASLAPHLRRRCTMLSATSGAQALEMLRSRRDVAVIISDMRMPGMDGATFLAASRAIAPDATRMLLTGHADTSSAIAAVNGGGIFRFLTKPCGPVELLSAVESALEQHRLVTAERELLEKTLYGSIKALTDVLALANPAAFGRATRVKQVVAAMAAHLAIRERWQIEVAAMLSQLGAISLPAETVERIYHGHTLSDDERKQLVTASKMVDAVLANIPRLEVVRAMLARLWSVSTDAVVSTITERALVDQGASLLRAAVEFDLLEAQGNAADVAISLLRSQAGAHPARVLDALAAVRGEAARRDDVREYPLGAVAVGMIFADDVRLTTGALLVPRGFEVTPSLIERVRSLRPGAVNGLVRVIAKP
jgi:CheY-like chemotaxis protein